MGRRIRRTLLGVVALFALVTAVASPASAYTGHAGCPNLGVNQAALCAYHTNIRWFTVTANGAHTIYFDGRGAACVGNPCTVTIDLIFHWSGRGSLLNDAPRVLYPNAWYLQ